MSWPTSQELAHYTCYRTAGPLTIDGKLDEPSWKLAPRSGRFVDIVTGKPAWFDTRVAILWDDTCLYFGFTAEETDVCATLTQRDSKIYEDNDLEVFIAGENAYYEFEINALNTVLKFFGFGRTSSSLATVISAGRSSIPPPTRRWKFPASAATCTRGASAGDFSI